MSQSSNSNLYVSVNSSRGIKHANTYEITGDVFYITHVENILAYFTYMPQMRIQKATILIEGTTLLKSVYL